MCGKIVKDIPARLPRHSNSVPKLLADIGPPRSLVNTYGDASCSRRRRRKARISSPCIGCTEGVDVDTRVLAPRRSHTDARLRRDPRGRHGSLCQELAARIMLKQTKIDSL